MSKGKRTGSCVKVPPYTLNLYAVVNEMIYLSLFSPGHTHTEWVIGYRAVGEIMSFHVIMLTEKEWKNLVQRIDVLFCVKIGRTASETLVPIKLGYGKQSLKKSNILEWHR